MAKTKSTVVTNTYQSSTDQSAETAENRFQKFAGGKIEQNDGAGAKVFGVLMDNPGVDEFGVVAHAGIVQVRAGAAVAVDTPIMSDATGRAIVATIGLLTVGRTLDEAAAAAGELITILLFASDDLTP